MSDVRSRRNTFSGHHLNRHGELRTDEAGLARARENSDTRFVLVCDDNILIREQSAFLMTGEQIDAIAAYPVAEIYLGEFQGSHVFTRVIEGEQPPLSKLEESDQLQFANLRLIGTTVPEDQASLLAYSRALSQWHLSHRHCSRCGERLRILEAGHVQICTNDACTQQQIFPRVDPAIIVLVSHEDRALLGRQADWPDGRYSTLAGFVEPGESLEDAVAREVMEESGVEVGQIRYHSSQPWPFPQSLMLGFMADALTQDIELRDGELEEARWVSVEDIIERDVGLPTALSISYRLVEDWFDAVSDISLADVRARRHKAQ